MSLCCMQSERRARCTCATVCFCRNQMLVLRSIHFSVRVYARVCVEADSLAMHSALISMRSIALVRARTKCMNQNDSLAQREVSISLSLLLLTEQFALPVRRSVLCHICCCFPAFCSIYICLHIRRSFASCFFPAAAGISIISSHAAEFPLFSITFMQTKCPLSVSQFTMFFFVSPSVQCSLFASISFRDYRSRHCTERSANVPATELPDARKLHGHALNKRIFSIFFYRQRRHSPS